MIDSYNGWTNFETWKVCLEFFGGYSAEDWVSEYSDLFISGKCIDVERFSTSLESVCVEMCDYDELPAFAKSCVDIVFGEVNWLEIAMSAISCVEENARFCEVKG